MGKGKIEKTVSNYWKNPQMIFISYSHYDKVHAGRLDSELRAAGAEVFIDYEVTRVGKSFPDRMNEALEWCDTLILLWSKNAKESRWVAKEWQYAMHAGKTIIPCTIDGTSLPPLLTTTLCFNIDCGFSQLFTALELVSQRGLVKPIVKPPSPKPLTKNMVLIPAGSFLMGSSENDNERPIHRVKLDEFYIDKYAVSVAEYAKFINDQNYREPKNWVSQFKKPNRPVVYVSWYDSQAYSKWAQKRLPTEAEWEYAARGGLEGKKYPWGDERPKGRANFGHCTFLGLFIGERDPDKFIKNVDAYEPNGYGLYQMAGNVCEWCQDWYEEDYYKNSPMDNPQGPSNGSYRVERGGDWRLFAEYVRVAYRGHGWSPDYCKDDLGFRCASSKIQ